MLWIVREQKRAMAFNDNRVLFSVSLIFGLFCSLGVYAQETSHPVVDETVQHFDKAFQELKEERDALCREIENLKLEQQALIDSVKKDLDIALEQELKDRQALEAAEEKSEALEKEKEELRERVDKTQVELDKLSDVLEEVKTLRKQRNSLISQLKMYENYPRLNKERILAQERELSLMKEKIKILIKGFQDIFYKFKYRLQKQSTL